MNYITTLEFNWADQTDSRIAKIFYGENYTLKDMITYLDSVNASFTEAFDWMHTTLHAYVHNYGPCYTGLHETTWPGSYLEHDGSYYYQWTFLYDSGGKYVPDDVGFCEFATPIHIYYGMLLKRMQATYSKLALPVMASRFDDEWESARQLLLSNNDESSPKQCMRFTYPLLQMQDSADFTWEGANFPA